MKQPELSIIIPAYQEAGRIGKTLDELAAFIKRHRYKDTEVLVVVATSPDGTAKIAQSKAHLFDEFKVVDAGPKVGKGRDVRTGMMEAKGKYKLFMDADIATPLLYIERVRDRMRHQDDIIIGVRNLGRSHTGWRKLLSNGGNWLVQLVLLPGIKDTQCGFKAFSAEAAEELFRRQTVLGWGFDMEVLAIARRLKYSIHQIKIAGWIDRPDGTFASGMSLAALETLSELATIIWRSYTGGYRNKRFNYVPYRNETSTEA